LKYFFLTNQSINLLSNYQLAKLTNGTILAMPFLAMFIGLYINNNYNYNIIVNEFKEYLTRKGIRSFKDYKVALNSLINYAVSIGQFPSEHIFHRWKYMIENESFLNIRTQKAYVGRLNKYYIPFLTSLRNDISN
jgi:hypothetical protein